MQPNVINVLWLLYVKSAKRRIEPSILLIPFAKQFGSAKKKQETLSHSKTCTLAECACFSEGIIRIGTKDWKERTYSPLFPVCPPMAAKREISIRANWCQSYSLSWDPHQYCNKGESNWVPDISHSELFRKLRILMPGAASHVNF